jgi:hypothetical protein
MQAANTDAIGALRWGLRRYRAVFLACLLLSAVAAPLVASQRETTVEAEALVIATRLDMQLEALPRYGQVVFNNGEVTRAIGTEFGDAGEVIPGRVYLVAEQDSIIFRVIGVDADPETAAAIADTAAASFVESLNRAGAGVGTFDLQSPADPPAGGGGALGLLIAVAVGIAGGLLLGLAAVAVLLVARRPVIAGPDAEETTGVPVLGTVTVPRVHEGAVAQPEDFPGLVPVCRRLLALPTPTIVLVSRAREEAMRTQVSAALAGVLVRIRDVRFIGASDLQGTTDEDGPRPATSDRDGRPAGVPTPLTLIDSSEPLDLVQPPHSTAAVLVIREGISSAALRAAVVEHLGGSAEARLLLVKPGRRLRRKTASDKSSKGAQAGDTAMAERT